jgi:hypothetical protein
LSLVTVGQTSPLAGTPLTDTQITAAIADCVAGGLTTAGCAYFTWSDETTTDPTQLLNGYVQNLATSRLLAATIGAGDTSLTVQNGAAFGTNVPFLILIDTEQITVGSVTPGSTTTFGTLSRGVNGTSAAGHSQAATVFKAYALNSSVLAGDTTWTLQDGQLLPATSASVNFSMQCESEIINVTSHTLNGATLTTVVRGASGTSAAGHAANTAVTYVWNDPGIISIQAQCVSQGVKCMYSPLGLTLRAVVVANPLLASTPDAILFETQRLQETPGYASLVATDVANIRAASGNKPVMVQVNAYSAFNNQVYDPQFVLEQMAGVVNACSPQWMSVEYLTSSIQQMETIIKAWRP